jgi:four helix bundle protein
MASQGFEQLAVWRQAMDLALRLYALTDRFPAEERSGLTGTLRRVSAALAAKIAEASAYEQPEKLRDACLTARGTLCDIQTHLFIAQRLGYPRAWSLWRVQRAIRRLDATLGHEIDALNHRRRMLALAHDADAAPAPTTLRSAA